MVDETLLGGLFLFSARDVGTAAEEAG